MITAVCRSKQWALFLGLFLISLIFHTYNLEHASYDLDEAAHIWHAQKPYSDVVAQASHDPNPPVYNLILSSWVKVFGVSEFSTRFLSVLFGALGVGIMFLIGSRNFGLAVGLMAALFYCFSPIQFRFTHLARPYSILMVTVLLSYGGLFEVLRNASKRRLFMYYLVTTAMLYMHPTSVFNLAAQGLMILTYHLKDWKSTLRVFVPMLLAFLSFVAWVVSIPYFERNDTMWFDAPGWEEVKYVLLVFYANGKLLILQLVLLLLAFALLLKYKNRDSVYKFLWLFLWCCIPFLLSICFSHLVKPVFQDKYILSVQPGMMLLLAYSIYQLRSKLIRLAGFVLASVIMLSSMDVTLNPEGDWRKAIEFLKNEQTNDESAILLNPWYEFRTFSYYYDRRSYKAPDSTFKNLVNSNVFTSWHDVYDTLNLKPKFDVFHSLVTHAGLNSRVLDIEVLKAGATLVREKKFIGINIETDALHRKMETQDEYSSSKVLSFSSLESDSSVSLTVKVDIMEYDNLDGVLMITSVENKEGKSVFYRSKSIVEGDVANGNLSFEDKIRFPEFKKDWVVTVFLRNTEQQNFQYRSLTITAD
jgi:hypothetical protein